MKTEIKIVIDWVLDRVEKKLPAYKTIALGASLLSTLKLLQGASKGKRPSEVETGSLGSMVSLENVAGSVLSAALTLAGLDADRDNVVGIGLPSTFRVTVNPGIVKFEYITKNGLVTEEVDCTDSNRAKDELDRIFRERN
jgi:hypothetical protein